MIPVADIIHSFTGAFDFILHQRNAVTGLGDRVLRLGVELGIGVAHLILSRTVRFNVCADSWEGKIHETKHSGTRLGRHSRSLRCARE